MKTKLETITPEIATALLKQNTRNRVKRDRHVDFLASEMVNGRWILTPDSIWIAPDGVLIDGQHRLMAIVQSGVTLSLHVSRDVPEDAQNASGFGAQRTVADQLQLAGMENAKDIVAAIRALVAICCYHNAPKIGTGFAQIVFEEFRKELLFTFQHIRPFKPGRKAWAIGALALAYSADRSVGSFIEALGSGENLRRDHPAFAIRKWFMDGGKSLRSTYKRRSVETLLNGAYNAITVGKYTQPRSGAQGLEYFTKKKSKTIKEFREQMKQQLAVSPSPVEKDSSEKAA